MWRFCSCADREGKQIKGKTGPCYYGVKIAKNVPGRGVGKAQEIMACHVYVQLRHQIRLNRGLCQIIAYEGDEIEMRGLNKFAPDATLGETEWRWKSATYKKVVPKYPRPHELPELQDLSFMEKAYAEESAAEEARDTRIIGRATEKKDAATRTAT